MPLTPFTMVEMHGMSIVTATWFMFIVAAMGAAAFLYFRHTDGVRREQESTNKRMDKHETDIVEIRKDVSGMATNIAVTLTLVERIDKRMDKELENKV